MRFTGTVKISDRWDLREVVTDNENRAPFSCMTTDYKADD